MNKYSVASKIVAVTTDSDSLMLEGTTDFCTYPGHNVYLCCQVVWPSTPWRRRTTALQTLAKKGCNNFQDSRELSCLWWVQEVTKASKEDELMKEVKTCSSCELVHSNSMRPSLFCKQRSAWKILTILQQKGCHKAAGGNTDWRSCLMASR